MTRTRRPAREGLPDETRLPALSLDVQAVSSD
jgi:hypothetical protein